MNKIKRLTASFERFISVPWRNHAAPDQRVVFCVYEEKDERRLRAKIDEFEIVTRRSHHEWAAFDLSHTFAQWLSGLRYAESYFQKPHLLDTIIHKYLSFIVDEFTAFLDKNGIDGNWVVALTGVGTLFGFLKVKDVVDKIAPMVKGRLLIFFPGSYENNNYRLLDGYDGWNYLAVSITGDEEF